MYKYTYKDVIIDPKDPRVEIGKTYFFALGVQACIDYANRGVRERTLERIDESLYNPFIGDEKDYPFIIRKKSPTYAERQDEWVETNNIKIGDKVRVTRTATDHENGWSNIWSCSEMDKAVNKVYEIVDINGRNGIRLNIGDYCCWFPYFVLEKVEELKFKVGDFVKEKGTEIVGMIIRESEEGFFVYQNVAYGAVLSYEAGELEPVKAHLEPFNLKEEGTREMLRGEWIRQKNEENMDESMIVGFFSVGDKRKRIGINLSHSYWVPAEEALSDWCFLDGSPCGLVVEDE